MPTTSTPASEGWKSTIVGKLGSHCIPLSLQLWRQVPDGRTVAGEHGGADRGARRFRCQRGADASGGARRADGGRGAENRAGDHPPATHEVRLKLRMGEDVWEARLGTRRRSLL